MKHTPNELFESLSKEFSNKKEIIKEELGGVITLKPLYKLTSEDFNPNKQPWETKYAEFVNEEKAKALEPIVNNDMKSNTLEQEEKVKADPKLKFEMDNKLGGSYKISDGVENIKSHNYDTKSENINNVNAQEVLTGIQLEINYNKELTLDEAKDLAVKNLSKNPLHYVQEGQFGVKGLGYAEQKVDVNDGETYGGSGYSTKLKSGSEALIPVKESKNNFIKRMISESLGGPRPMEEDFNTFDEAKDKAIAASQEKAGIKEEEEDVEVKKSPSKPKKAKKESIDSKLSEIGRQGDVVKLEAQINFLDEIIEEKAGRLSSISEDENLSGLVDKKKMKEMEKEVKLLGKRKAQMEKVYEKMCGKAYQKPEIVDEVSDLEEMDAVSFNDKNNPTQGASGERDPKKVGTSTGAYSVNK